MTPLADATGAIVSSRLSCRQLPRPDSPQPIPSDVSDALHRLSGPIWLRALAAICQQKVAWSNALRNALRQ